MNEKKAKTEEENRKVLLVDDDAFLVDMYATKFKERGFHVVTASDGVTALHRIVEEGYEPDAILLDVVMPGIDGFELLAQIKKEPGARKATTIMLSNQGQDADLNQAKELGADCYIIKASAVPSAVVDRVSVCMAEHSHA